MSESPLFLLADEVLNGIENAMDKFECRSIAGSMMLGGKELDRGIYEYQVWLDEKKFVVTIKESTES